MLELPQNAPRDMNQAFAYIGSVTCPTIDDLKIMVILEAAGKTMYEELACSASDPAIRELLIASGGDELTHACRVSQAIAKLTGSEYPVPLKEENPYLVAWKKPALAPELTDKLAETEFQGEGLYERWAVSCPNAEVSQLFRQNGCEEANHGRRLKEVTKLLASGESLLAGSASHV